MLCQVFRGSLQSHLTCKACGHESIKNESFLDLSLSLNHCAAQGATPNLSVPDDFTGSDGPLVVSPPDSQHSVVVPGDRAALANAAGVGSVSMSGFDVQDEEEDSEPALSLADCLRSFTTLETLGEKIVSFC